MKRWPHSPAHELSETGAYIVTAATYKKEPVFHSKERLSQLCDFLFEFAEKYGWQPQAWAIFPNHYHFVANAPSNASSLKSFLRQMHSVSAIYVNKLDRAAGRKIWFQFWETHLTFEKSFYARLNYVHNNAVRHGLVGDATNYPWCSAAWFQQKATPSFQGRILDLTVDRVSVPDDYKVKLEWLTA